MNTVAFIVAIIIFLLTILFLVMQDIGPFIAGIDLALALTIMLITYPKILIRR